MTVVLEDAVGRSCGAAYQPAGAQQQHAADGPLRGPPLNRNVSRHCDASSQVMGEDDILSIGLTLDEARTRYPLKRKDPTDPWARITSCFFITGDPLDLERCTKAAGTAPTSTREKRICGDLVASGRPNLFPAEWELAVVREPSVEVDACVEELLDLVSPRLRHIRRLLASCDYKAGFLTTVTVFDQTPILGLSADSLERLAAFGLDWYLDIC